jgi:hypothetical protein
MVAVPVPVPVLMLVPVPVPVLVPECVALIPVGNIELGWSVTISVGR